MKHMENPAQALGCRDQLINQFGHFMKQELGIHCVRCAFIMGCGNWARIPCSFRMLFAVMVVVSLMAKEFGDPGFRRDLLQVWMYWEDGFFFFANLTR